MAKSNAASTEAEGEKKSKFTQKVQTLFAEQYKGFKLPGDTLEGLYVGNHWVDPEKGKNGGFWAYHIQTEDGQRVSISGAALDNIMPQIPRNVEIQVIFRGMISVGRNEMKDFEVNIEEGVELLDPSKNRTPH